MRLGLEAGGHTLDVAAEEGIGGVPISADKLVTDGAAKTLEPLKERNLNVCQIGAFGYNPLSTDRERQASQTEMLKKAIPLAAETGCPYIVICGGNYHPSGYGAGDVRNFAPGAIDDIARDLEPVLRLAEAHAVKLSIEPYLKTAICSPEAFLALKAKVGTDALRVNLDVTSFYGLEEMWDPAAKVDEVCTMLVGHYGLGHIKGIVLAEGFHIHIGLGPIAQDPTDWAQMLRLAAPHMPEDSWMILEHVATVEEARESLAIVRKAAAEAGVSLS